MWLNYLFKHTNPLVYILIYIGCVMTNFILRTIFYGNLNDAISLAETDVTIRVTTFLNQ